MYMYDKHSVFHFILQFYSLLRLFLSNLTKYNHKFQFFSQIDILIQRKKLIKIITSPQFLNQMYKSYHLSSIEIGSSILDSKVSLELLELFYEPFIGFHTWAFQTNKHETILEGGLVFVHEISYKECGRARDSCRTVDQNVAASSFILDEADNRKEGVTHFFVFAITKFQLMDRDAGIIGDGEVHGRHYGLDIVFFQERGILGKMQAAQPHLAKSSIGLQDLLSFVEKWWHFQLGHFFSNLFLTLQKLRNFEYLLIFYSKCRCIDPFRLQQDFSWSFKVGV